RPPRADRRAAQRARPLRGPALGAPVPRRRRVARLLAAQARLPRRLARPPREGGVARGDLGRRERRLRLPGPARRPRPPRARAGSVLARAPVPPVIPRWLAVAVPAYFTALLAIDTQVRLPGQLVLGAVTWGALAAVCALIPVERRAQVLVVVGAATIAEVTGSILWGVYRYRMHNLPLFVPPWHGLVYLSGVALSHALRRHARMLVGC